MTHLDATIVLIVCSAGTYAFRGGVVLLSGGRMFPPVIERALQNVGPAVLAALTVNLAVSGGGGSGVDIVPAEVAALLIAGLVAVWRKNLLWTLAVGMVAIWILAAF